MDAAGPEIGNYLEREGHHEEDTMIEDPNLEARQFFELVKAAQSPLWDGCDRHSVLSTSLAALSLKADYGLSEGCFNGWVQLMGDAMPDDNKMPKNFNQAKKSLAELGLASMQIECCPNGCMLYYKEDEVLQNCKHCGEQRYRHVTRRGKLKLLPLKSMWYFPLVPRLQRLYSSMQTAREMRWHRENQRETGSLSHPSGAEAWKHFDEAWPTFSQDPRNVRLGLCSDGFAPFDQTGRNYSCWPVIVTPYNFPPWMCMRREFMFLTLIILGPHNPKKKIDVYLRPLIDELKILWESGVMTYDVSLKQNFLMKAVLMWMINDFPAYGMLSGWMTMGKLGCPICMERSKAFSLTYSRKTSWFDCHRQFLPQHHPYRRNKTAFIKGRVEKSAPPQRLSGEEVWEGVKHYPSVEECPEPNIPGYGIEHHWTKRSIFWELPYWKTHLLPHNIDVMHTERNVFLNILFTVMDTKGKTRDTCKSRKDLEVHCKPSGLELQASTNGNFVKPKAQFTVTKQQRLGVCEWVKNLKLPDGYVSNMSRCVDLREAKLVNMKSHDCHVFMQRLLPIAFKAFPKPILNTLTEFSQFFREITSSLLKEDKLRMLEENIPIIMCKLEQIFPPSFFDSMEHLPIHLAYEAKVDGPVQYRWMYPFESFDPPIQPTREITKIIKKKFEVSWMNYGEVKREDEKWAEMWFDEFKRIYKWLPEHEAEIKKSFDHKASDGYSNAMYRVRKKMDAGTWIPKKNRDELEQKWADEDWKAKAIINRNNRTSSDGSLHTGGSIPTTEHYKRLKNSSDETPTCWDLFEKTHKMKGETPKWVSSKAEKIANEYESRILERDSQEALGDGVCSEQSDNNIFLEVVGGVDKKKRIFGLGSEGGNHISSSKKSMGIPVSEYMQMKTAFSNLTAENQSLKEQVGGLLATQEKMLKFMETYSQNHPRPPSPPLANEDDQQNDNDYYDEELDC